MIIHDHIVMWFINKTKFVSFVALNKPLWLSSDQELRLAISCFSAM